MGIIYCYHNVITGKKYIGQTTQLWERYRYVYHKNYYKTTDITTNKFINSLRKYGFDSFIYGVIEYCDDDELNVREIHYIHHYDTFNNGYNTTLGGGGLRGHRHSEETKKLMSVSHKGKHPMSESHKQIIRECNTGRKYTPEQREKHRQKCVENGIRKRGVSVGGDDYILVYDCGRVEFINSLAHYAVVNNISPYTLYSRCKSTHKCISGSHQRRPRHKPLSTGLLHIIKYSFNT